MVFIFNNNNFKFLQNKIHRFKQYNNNIVIESISAETSESEQKYMIKKCFSGNNCIPIIYVTPDQTGHFFFQVSDSRFIIVLILL